MLGAAEKRLAFIGDHVLGMSHGLFAERTQDGQNRLGDRPATFGLGETRLDAFGEPVIHHRNQQLGLRPGITEQGAHSDICRCGDLRGGHSGIVLLGEQPGGRVQDPGLLGCLLALTQ